MSWSPGQRAGWAPPCAEGSRLRAATLTVTGRDGDRLAALAGIVNGETDLPSTSFG